MRWYEQACWQVGPRVDEWTLTELTRGRASPLPCQVVRDMTLSQLLRWPMIIELGVLVALPPIEKDGILAELPTTEVCLSMKKWSIPRTSVRGNRANINCQFARSVSDPCVRNSCPVIVARPHALVRPPTVRWAGGGGGEAAAVASRRYSSERGQFVLKSLTCQQSEIRAFE